jgi:hypothetical protein
LHGILQIRYAWRREEAKIKKNIRFKPGNKKDIGA